MLYYLFLNLSSCYMQLNHFDESRIVLDEAGKLAPNNSLYLYRSAQNRAFCLDSTEEDLVKAKEEILKAREVKKTEKIFQHPVNLLKMLNVHNLEEALSELQIFTDNRSKELKILKSCRLEKVF